jgi:hypothetical protein
LCTTGDPVSVATDEEGTNDEDSEVMVKVLYGLRQLEVEENHSFGVTSFHATNASTLSVVFKTTTRLTATTVWKY